MSRFITLLALLLAVVVEAKRLVFTPHVHVSETREEYTVYRPAKRGVRYNGLAVAVLHGLGDSCFNSGMKRTVELIQEILPGSYVKCIPVGDNFAEDSGNSFSMPMNQQVDLLMEGIMADPNFYDGFNAIGISQGNLQIRGYIQRYGWRDDFPSVSSFISIHGPLMGVSALPGCEPGVGVSSGFCETLNGLAGELVYSNFIQNTIAPANYYKEPTLIPQYLGTDFLTFLNFEREDPEIQGLGQLNQLVLVKALQDTVVQPPDSSWFSYFQDGTYDVIEAFDETPFFKNRNSGLRSLNRFGKVFLEYTPDGHVVFSQTWLSNLILKYWG